MVFAAKTIVFIVIWCKGTNFCLTDKYLLLFFLFFAKQKQISGAYCIFPVTQNPNNALPCSHKLQVQEIYFCKHTKICKAFENKRAINAKRGVALFFAKKNPFQAFTASHYDRNIPIMAKELSSKKIREQRPVRTIVAQRLVLFAQFYTPLPPSAC